MWGQTRSIRSPDWLTAGFATLLGVGLIVAASSQLAIFSSAHSHLAKKVHPAVFAMLKPSILYTGLILAALAIVGRNIAARARGRSLSLAAFVLLALTTPVLLARWIAPLRAYAETNSSRRLAQHTSLEPGKRTADLRVLLFPHQPAVLSSAACGTGDHRRERVDQQLPGVAGSQDSTRVITVRWVPRSSRGPSRILIPSHSTSGGCWISWNSSTWSVPRLSLG